MRAWVWRRGRRWRSSSGATSRTSRRTACEETLAFLGGDPANTGLTWETLPGRLTPSQMRIDVAPETVVAWYRREHLEMTPDQVLIGRKLRQQLSGRRVWRSAAAASLPDNRATISGRPLVGWPTRPGSPLRGVRDDADYPSSGRVPASASITTPSVSSCGRMRGSASPGAYSRYSGTPDRPCRRSSAVMASSRRVQSPTR